MNICWKWIKIKAGWGGKVSFRCFRLCYRWSNSLRLYADCGPTDDVADVFSSCWPSHPCFSTRWACCLSILCLELCWSWPLDVGPWGNVASISWAWIQGLKWAFTHQLGYQQISSLVGYTHKKDSHYRSFSASSVSREALHSQLSTRTTALARTYISSLSYNQDISKAFPFPPPPPPHPPPTLTSAHLRPYCCPPTLHPSRQLQA